MYLFLTCGRAPNWDMRVVPRLLESQTCWWVLPSSDTNHGCAHLPVHPSSREGLVQCIPLALCTSLQLCTSVVAAGCLNECYVQSLKCPKTNRIWDLG